MKTLFSIMIFLCASSSWSCLYFDKNFDRKLFNETEREAFLFRDKEAVNLVLKTGFKGQLPPTLAWVFPLPSKPLSYKEVDMEVFDELRELFNIKHLSNRGSDNLTLSAPAHSAAKTIAIHQQVNVGNYEIIPIEILSEHGSGDELNNWLKNQNFIELPPRIQKPYLKKGAYFLAIRLKPQGSDMNLKPLLVRYKSETMSFPIRFTHDERTFDFTLYMLGPSATLAGTGFGRIDTICLKKQNPFENNEKLKGLTASAKEANVLYQFKAEGINKYIQTAKLSQDPELLEKNKSSWCK